MKKIVLFAAAAAVALSSCSKNEVYVNPADAANAIGFGTYVGSATKAVVEDKFAAGDVFVIDAYYTKANDMDAANTTYDKFMQNQTVTATATSEDVDGWKYSPIKYWPNNDGDKVSFFAVTNATENSPIVDFVDGLTTDHKPSFTVAAANTDIMIASALNQTKTADAISFEFQHTMAQVKFTAKTTNTFDATLDNTTIKITSLSVDYGTGKQGGTFTFDIENANTGTWAVAKDGEERAKDEFKAEDGLSNVLINTALTTTSETLGTPLMILPIANQEYTVTVVYDVVTVDSSDKSDANNSTITNTCTFKIAPTAMNTIYTYNLEIGVTAVKVSGNITGEWGEQEGTVEIIDSEVDPVTVVTKDPNAKDPNAVE